MFEIRELQSLTNQNPANTVPCGIQIPLHLLEPMTFIQFIRVCLQQNGVQFEEVAGFGVPFADDSAENLRHFSRVVN